MRSIKVHRGTAFFSGVFVNIIVWGIWWWLVNVTYGTFDNISDGRDVVEINVIGLWFPVGMIGAGLFTIASPAVALITGRRSDSVWGRKGIIAGNFISASFAILGVISAVFFYQRMMTELDAKGYLYCRPLTTFSAMGRYEVYVAKPELCVKPDKIP